MANRVRSASQLRQKKRLAWKEVRKEFEQRRSHKKVNLTLNVDARLVQRARDLRLNISSIAETALFFYTKWVKKKKEVVSNGNRIFRG